MLVWRALVFVSYSHASECFFIFMTSSSVSVCVFVRLFERVFTCFEEKNG